MRDALLEEYDAVRPGLLARGEELRATLEEMLVRHDLKVHSVTLRVKSRASLADKLARHDRSYATLWAVTDVIGLRVIVYFDDAVDRVGQLLEAHLSPRAALVRWQRHGPASP